MDLATMVVVLLFGSGDAKHFIQGQPNMSACQRAVAGQKSKQISGPAEADYIIYRVCLPVSSKVFAGITSHSESPRTSPCGRGNLRASASAMPGALYLRWTGTIRAPLYQKIAVQFEKAKSQVRTVYLQISSCGGEREEMERAIGLLRSIKRTHTLVTIVDHGGLCASACVPVFLQGERRRGALTSSFHEVWYWSDREHIDARVDRATTERFFQDYFLSSGVSENWLNHPRIMVQHSDYWQTGENLWSDKSGIITDPLDNLVPQNTETQRY